MRNVTKENMGSPRLIPIFNDPSLLVCVPEKSHAYLQKHFHPDVFDVAIVSHAHTVTQFFSFTRPFLHSRHKFLPSDQLERAPHCPVWKKYISIKK